MQMQLFCLFSEAPEEYTLRGLFEKSGFELKEKTGKIFEKSMIRFQCTLVKFRNGTLGLAINDKISVRDFDGDEVFMIYDTESKKFTGCKRLVCYDDNLRNELSTVANTFPFIMSFISLIY